MGYEAARAYRKARRFTCHRASHSTWLPITVVIALPVPMMVVMPVVMIGADTHADRADVYTDNGSIRGAYE